MASIIFDIFLNHSTKIDTSILRKCNMISKEIKNMIDDSIWNKASYETASISKDDDLITSTDAKNKWYLTDDDLDIIPSLDKYHRAYRKYYRLFSVNDIFEYAIYKYKGITNFRTFIQMKLDKKQKRAITMIQNKQKKLEKKNERSKTIKEILEEKNMKAYSGLDICDQYIDGSIKKIDDFVKKLEEHDNKMKLLRNRKIDLIEKLNEKDISYEENGAFTSYVNGHIDNIDQAVEIIYKKSQKKKMKEDRTKNLRNKLKVKGLELRSDSHVCKEYISGHRDDIDEVVTIMLEMQYFMRKTNYKSILNGLINNYKDTIRSMYGRVDYDEYNDLIQEEIPVLSLEAKKLAVKKRQDVPEYCRKYLQ